MTTTAKPPRKPRKPADYVLTKKSIIRFGKSTSLTGITLARQYGKLMDVFGGDYVKAGRVQTEFNKQFSRAKRTKFWNPGHIIR